MITTYLIFNGLIRVESDPIVIANLERKGWVATSPPSYDAATQHAPEWVNGAWVVRDKTAEERAAERTAALPPAENFQVRAWMIRSNLSPDLVPTIISQVVPESVPGGINRAEALMRWDYAVKVPRDFMLVDVIGAQMGLTPTQIDAAWPEILSL